MNALVANRVVAVPVAAPQGQWIGAGGSMIMESDKQTEVVRKHYIGMVTMLDIVAHIADNDHDQMMGGSVDGVADLERKMMMPVSSIIGHCPEGLSLWTLNPNTSNLSPKELVTCQLDSPLSEVIDNVVSKPSVGGGSTRFTSWACFSHRYSWCPEGFAVVKD